MGDQPQLSPTQEAELRRLKSYFPYRIVWGCLGPNGEFEAYADADKRKMNAKLRAGWIVFKMN